MQKTKSILILIIVALMLAACGGNQAATPTISVADVQTMAVSTFASGLTQTAAAMPTNTPTITPTPANTVVATFASLNANGTPGTAVGSPTASCYRLLYVSDVTIPDHTQVTAGERIYQDLVSAKYRQLRMAGGFQIHCRRRQSHGRLHFRASPSG